MLPPLLSPEEFAAELRRHGLRPTGLQRPNFRIWRNESATVFVAVQELRGFIPRQILVETLHQAGLEFSPHPS